MPVLAMVRLHAPCEMVSSESCSFSPESAILEKTVLPNEAPGVADGAQSVKDGEGVLEGWDGKAVGDGRQRLEFRGNAADSHGDFVVLDERRFLWVAKSVIPRYHECVAWLGGLPFSPASASKSWPKKSLQATSFAISVHHFSMSAEPARASRSILATIVRTLALIGSSHFKIVGFEKPCEKSLWRSPWVMGCAC